MATKPIYLLAMMPILLLLAALVSVTFLQPVGDLSTTENLELRGPTTIMDRDMLAEFLDASMVFVPAGDFWMGSDVGRPDEQPQHRVYLDAYWIDRYEVTNAQYRRFLLEQGRRPPRYWSGMAYPDGQDMYPVSGVSWDCAQSYCAWRSKRLPTEAEWEKACRGGLQVAGVANSMQTRLYPWGDSWGPEWANNGYYQSANWPLFLDDAWALLASPTPRAGFPSLFPVGSYSSDASPYGVFDLAGNVSEWMFDWYNWDGYAQMADENPVGLGPPWNHSVRGGAWFDRRGEEDLISELCRCPARSSSHSFDDPRIGFRCVKPAY